MRQAGRRELADALVRIRRQTLGFFEGAVASDLAVPYLPIINPPLWEAGHVAWFWEYWCLRWPLPASAGPRDGVALADSLLPGADALYDSGRVAHRSRWSLPLPTLALTRDYLERTLEACLARLDRLDDSDAALYFHRLAFFHECMHLEAFGYTWQTLGRALPGLPRALPPARRPGALLALAAGDVRLGRDGMGFSHDNERPARTVSAAACRIGASPVTNGEYLAFVGDGGYRDPRWWRADAWAALGREGREAPRNWTRGIGLDGPWQMRWYGQALPLDPLAAVVQVDADEAQAYCQWAGARLPTEAQWQHAAQTLSEFDWGCQVWEWTADPFEPLPGFAPGPYRDYSAPWFHDHRVVRGAAFFTPREMVDTQFRNFYRPERADPFLGFRVCHG